MPNIFVNYRSGDTDGVAALVERELSRRFGPRACFRDAKSIPAGDDWPHALLKAVRQSDVVLVFIGRHWLDALNAKERRVDGEADWVKEEILEAFRYDIRVIPILVGQVDCPTARALPAALAKLASCQALHLHPRTQDADLDRLAEQLTELVPDLAEIEERGTEGVPPASAPTSVRNFSQQNVGQGVQAENIYGGVVFGGSPERSPGRGASGAPGGEDGR